MLFDVDFVCEGSNLLFKLVEWLNESVFLLIWIVCGFVIVCWEDSGCLVVVNVWVGLVMLLLNFVMG